MIIYTGYIIVLCISIIIFNQRSLDVYQKSKHRNEFNGIYNIHTFPKELSDLLIDYELICYAVNYNMAEAVKRLDRWRQVAPLRILFREADRNHKTVWLSNILQRKRSSIMLLHQTVYIIVAVRADSQTIYKLLWFQGQIIILTTKGTKYNDAISTSILVSKTT